MKSGFARSSVSPFVTPATAVDRLIRPVLRASISPAGCLANGMCSKGKGAVSTNIAGPPSLPPSLPGTPPRVDTLLLLPGCVSTRRVRIKNRESGQMAASDGTQAHRMCSTQCRPVFTKRQSTYSRWVEYGLPLPTSARVQSPPRHVKRWHQVAPVRGN